MKKIIMITAAVLGIVLLVVLLTRLNAKIPGDPAAGGTSGDPGSSAEEPTIPQPIVKDGYVTPALWAKPEKTVANGQTIVPDTAKSLFAYRIGTYHGNWYGYTDVDGEQKIAWTEDVDLFEVFEDGRIHHFVPGASPYDEYKPMGVISTEKYDYLRYFFMYADDDQHILHDADLIFSFTPTYMGQSMYTKALSKVPYGTKLEIGIRDVDAVAYPSYVERDIYVYCFGYTYEDRLLYEAGYAAGLSDAKAGNKYIGQNDPVRKQGYQDGYVAGGGQVVYSSGSVTVDTGSATVICDAQIYEFYKARGLQNGQTDKAAKATYDLTRGFDPSLPNCTGGYLAAYAEGYRNGYTGSEIDPENNFYLININGSYEFTANAALAGDPAGYAYQTAHDGLNLFWNTTDSFTAVCPVCGTNYRFVTRVVDDVATIEIYSADDCFLAMDEMGECYLTSVPAKGVNYVTSVNHCGVTIWLPPEVPDSCSVSCPVCGDILSIVGGSIV